MISFEYIKNIFQYSWVFHGRLDVRKLVAKIIDDIFTIRLSENWIAAMIDLSLLVVFYTLKTSALRTGGKINQKFNSG